MPKGEATLKRAVALDPTNAETLYQLADITACLGRRDEGIAMMHKALAMEPLNAQFHFNMGQFLLALGRIDEAEGEFRRSIDLQPTAEGFHFYLTLAYIKHGELDLALASANAGEPNRSYSTIRSWRWLTSREATRSRDWRNWRTCSGWTQTSIHQTSPMSMRLSATPIRPLSWLERGYDTRDSGVTVLYEDPIIVHALRSDPRLAAFTRKLGVPDPNSVLG